MTTEESLDRFVHNRQMCRTRIRNRTDWTGEHARVQCPPYRKSADSFRLINDTMCARVHRTEKTNEGGQSNKFILLLLLQRKKTLRYCT